MNPESDFWSKIKDKVPGKWRRMESGITSGLPDCLCLVKRVTCLVELKNKPTYLEGLGTTKLQRHWGRSWCENGGRCFLLAKAGNDVLFLWSADVGDKLLVYEWRTRALVFSDDLRSFDWDAVKYYMVHHLGY